MLRMTWIGFWNRALNEHAGRFMHWKHLIEPLGRPNSQLQLRLEIKGFCVDEIF